MLHKCCALRCTNHICQNVKDKLRDLNVSQSVTKEILADIFGTRIGTQFESGLADAQSEALFRKSLEPLKLGGTTWKRAVILVKENPSSMLGLPLQSRRHGKMCSP